MQRNIFCYGATLRFHWGYFCKYYNFLGQRVDVGLAKAAIKTNKPKNTNGLFTAGGLKLE